ncbi:MAG TPA: MBOAT family protein [Gammaproteobacteria bacterium]
MIFTSLAFLVFFAIVITLYWRLDGLQWKQWFLLVASVVFYAWWDYRFLALIAVVITVSYLGARGIERYRPRARSVIAAAIAVLLTLLGIFKYAGFLSDTLRSLLSYAGLHGVHHISVVLPIGISFFTFHGISYLMDVYRGKIPAQKSVSKVALYILFFPQLVAGPIVRASVFMPQLEREPHFDSDETLRGIKLFLIGFLYKTVLADSIAPYVDDVFGALGHYGPGDRLLASLGFYAQIYFDFAGYSIMAIGMSRMLGYRLPRNFEFPYLSTSVTEFWRRWHISLSSWLRDYLYIPLGGNRVGEARQLVNIMITMLLGGLWHGASWNFVIWGGMHGLALCLHKLYGKWQPAARAGSLLRDLLSSSPCAWFVTQAFVLTCWVPFRAVTWHDTWSVWSALPHIASVPLVDNRMLIVIVVPLIIDTAFVSGRIKLPLAAWQGWFSGRPWRVALVLGTMFGLALMIMPLVVKPFIYFRF